MPPHTHASLRRRKDSGEIRSVSWPVAGRAGNLIVKRPIAMLEAVSTGGRVDQRYRQAPVRNPLADPRSLGRARVVRLRMVSLLNPTRPVSSLALTQNSLAL